jgi:short-subunit dehydrogenase
MITGASSGIGEAAARLFAQKGVKVVITSERAADLQQVADSVNQSGGCAIPIVVDFTKPEEVEALFKRAEEAAGPISTLVNNAGVGMKARIDERTMEDVRFLFEINFFAVVCLCRQALNRMGERGGGRIINVSSAAGQFGAANFSAYSATKGALHTYTQALRVEARERGVMVTEVAPISVETAFFDNARGKSYRPRGVVLTVEKVAQCIVKVAESARPPAEALPYKPVRAVFVANSLLPGLLTRFARKKGKNEEGLH